MSASTVVASPESYDVDAPSTPNLLAISRFSTWSSIASEQQESDTCFEMDIDMDVEEAREAPSPALSDGGSSCFSQDIATPQNITAVHAEYFEKQMEPSPTLLPPSTKPFRPNLKRFGQFFPQSPSGSSLYASNSASGHSGMHEEGAAGLLWQKLEALSVQTPNPTFAFTPATPSPANQHVANNTPLRDATPTMEEPEPVVSDDSWNRALMLRISNDDASSIPEGLRILLQQMQ